MKVHHVGYAVKEISAAARAFELLGFCAEGSSVTDEARKVVILFMRSGQTLVELVAPLGEDSPVRSHLRKSGPSPYHICYESRCLEKDIGELRGRGFVLFEGCREAVAIQGRHVAFLHSASIGIIELVQA